MKVLHFTLKSKENSDLAFLNDFYFIIDDKDKWRAIHITGSEFRDSINYFLDELLPRECKVIRINDKNFNRDKIISSLVSRLNSFIPMETNIELIDEELNRVTMSLYSYLKFYHKDNKVISKILKISDFKYKNRFNKINKIAKKFERIFE